MRRRDRCHDHWHPRWSERWHDRWHERWHDWHEHGRRGGLRGYVGARMHRLLFAWFGIAIVAAGFAVGGVFRLVGDPSHMWDTERLRAEAFLGDQMARVWDKPAERDAFVQGMASQLVVGVRVKDRSGALLETVNYPFSCRTALHLRVHRDGVWLGSVDVCADMHRQGPRPGMLLLAIFVAVTVLWGIAGKVSRRIARPLSELTIVARDIGEGNLESRRRLHHHHRFDEIGDLSEAVHDMAERIERQLRDQRELLATVSHELRTPLQRIRLLLEMTAGTDPKILAEIDAEVMEMDALVGDLLASARVDFAALAPRSLDAADVARRAVERAGAEHATCEVGDDVGVIIADATLLSRALAAVLDNARKYGGTHAVLRVRSTDDGVAFDVDDDGPGFTPGDEEKVLEPFYRAKDKAGVDARGVGLGLALVKRIAQAHGGRAYAMNLPEGGARVGIEIPRSPRARRPA